MNTYGQYMNWWSAWDICGSLSLLCSSNAACWTIRHLPSHGLEIASRACDGVEPSFLSCYGLLSTSRSPKHERQQGLFRVQRRGHRQYNILLASSREKAARLCNRTNRTNRTQTVDAPPERYIRRHIICKEIYASRGRSNEASLSEEDSVTEILSKGREEGETREKK
jgi:hypothetical protein